MFLEAKHSITEWVEFTGLLIEVFGVAIIVFGLVFATGRLLSQVIGNTGENRMQSYKYNIGRILILGLEILVAGDVAKTVALEPTIERVGALGLLVLIRTFLGWSLVVEIEGRWPWQSKARKSA